LNSLALSIVIPNWNGRPLLERFLPSVIESAHALECSTGQPTEVLIADDASTDDSESWLRANWPRVRFESSPRRQGFAPTANRGVRSAGYPLVYLVNNDVALIPETLPPLIPHFRDPNVFAVSGNAYDFATGVLRGAGQRGGFRHGFLRVHSRFFVPDPAADPAPDAQPLHTIFVSGGGALFDRDKFLSLGGFDGMFAPYGWEDVELSLRAWKQGFELRYEPRSSIWHHFSSTIGARIPHRRVSATYERNRLLLHWLHLDTRSQWASHGLAVATKLLTAPLLGRTEYWRASVQAWTMRNEVRVRRAQLQKSQQRSLTEIFRQIESQMSRPGIRALDRFSAPIRPYMHSQNASPFHSRSGIIK
jgi:GT2 family glycosyltransferase